MNEKAPMSQKNKMIAFGSAVGAVLLALIVVLVLVLSQSGKRPNDPTPSGNDVPNSSTSDGADPDGPVPSGDDLPATTGDAAPDSSAAPAVNTTSGKTMAAGNKTTSRTPDKTTSATSKATSAATTSSSEHPSGSTYSLLQDPTFKNGFRALGLDSSNGGSVGRAIFDPLGSNGRQYWNLASWASRYAFGDMNYTTLVKLSPHTFKYVNPTKEFTYDTDTGAMTFTGITSKCYDTPRTGSEPWLHLLIEQNFRSSEARVTELSKVELSMKNRLTMFKDNMGDAFNPNAHAAQFLMYLMVTNRDQASKDYNKYIWFGIGFFDNRTEWGKEGSMLDKGTGSLMVSIGTELLYKKANNNYCWKNGKVNADPNGQWSSFTIDLLPRIEAALLIAQHQGYLKNTQLDQLYITGMNMGWEIPGSYDATMEVKDFRLDVTRK